MSRYAWKGHRCRCFLGFEPPDGITWWRPDLGDDDPGPSVAAFVRFGDDPGFRRAVRREDGSGFDEHGAGVNFYRDITPPMPWLRVGMCWDDKPHPVVAARQLDDGEWVTNA